MNNKQLNNHQTKAVEALIIISELLKSNNIPFFLLAGTALGAIREKGMIAWDDDIDIGVFYEDEDKVANVLISNLPNEYKWIDRHSNPKYAKLHGKVLYNDSCVIDIFPLVKTSDNALLRRIQWIERKVLSKTMKAKIPGSNYVDKYSKHFFIEKAKLVFSNILSKIVPRSLIEKMIDGNALRFQKVDGHLYVNMYSIYSLEKELIMADWLNKPSLVEFEGKEYPTVGDTDSYLRKLYGDYMTPPPEKDRISHHDSVF